MQFTGTSLVSCLLVGVACAQIPEDVLKSKLTSVRYAPLAEQARIQGNVRLNLNAGVITVTSKIAGVSGVYVLKPTETVTGSGVLEWTCDKAAGTTMDDKYRPANCRG